MNVQVYWDGNSGSVEYESKRILLTDKPVVENFSFDTVVYSEDDKVFLKTLNGATAPLTDTEKASLLVYAKEAVVEPSRPVIETIVDNRLAQCFYSIYSFEEELKGDTTAKLEYCVADTLGCSITDSTQWCSPVEQTYDITLRVGFEAVQAPATATIALLKNGEVVKQGAVNFTETEGSNNPTVELQVTDYPLLKDDKLSVKITGLTTGITVLSRSYLLIEPTGKLTGKRVANYFFNTLGNLLFTQGIQGYLMNDNGKPSMTVGTVNSEVVIL